MPRITRERRSAHAELVALRIAHRDGVAPDGVVFPGDAGAGLNQPLHLLADQPLAFLAADIAPGHPDVEVDPVLGGLALRHALEEQPGTLACRVDPGGAIAALLFRYPRRPGELLPAHETLRRRLDDIVQRQPPEFGQLLRFGGVEDDLDLGVHVMLLQARSCAVILPQVQITSTAPTAHKRGTKPMSPFCCYGE